MEQLLRKIPLESQVTFPLLVTIICVEMSANEARASALLYKITSLNKEIKKLDYIELVN